MNILQGIKLSGCIVPTASTDSYSTHDERYGRGSYRSVMSLRERDSITIDRRVEGMLVNVIENDKVYKLVGGISNTNWREFVIENKKGKLLITKIIIDENTNINELESIFYNNFKDFYKTEYNDINGEHSVMEFNYDKSLWEIIEHKYKDGVLNLDIKLDLTYTDFVSYGGMINYIKTNYSNEDIITSKLELECYFNKTMKTFDYCNSYNKAYSSIKNGLYHKKMKTIINEFNLGDIVNQILYEKFNVTTQFNKNMIWLTSNNLYSLLSKKQIFNFKSNNNERVMYDIINDRYITLDNIENIKLNIIEDYLLDYDVTFRIIKENNKNVFNSNSLLKLYLIEYKNEDMLYYSFIIKPYGTDVFELSNIDYTFDKRLYIYSYGGSSKPLFRDITDMVFEKHDNNISWQVDKKSIIKFISNRKINLYNTKKIKFLIADNYGNCSDLTEFYVDSIIKQNGYKIGLFIKK